MTHDGLDRKSQTGQMLAIGVLPAVGALLAVQVMKVVAWVKYGDWLMIVLYISVAEKTAPGVSMGSALVEVVASVEVVVGTFFSPTGLPNFGEHLGITRYGTYGTRTYAGGKT
jgi:hypothetical protein